ncbi:MAG: riboflavin synthase [bacterium]
MFSGIIEELGRLERVEGDSFVIQVSPAFFKELKLGSSVAVNGTCLTVKTLISPSTLTVEVMNETRKRTALGEQLKPGNSINLELALLVTQRLEGHIVQGHVDGVGTVKAVTVDGNSQLFDFEVPAGLEKYIIEKGSIAVNGVSLTVISIQDRVFRVGIIPYTSEHTTFGTLKAGDPVNLEVDMVAKYIEKFHLYA